MEIKLILTLDQVNAILKTLDGVAHRIARPLIDTITEQAQKQIKQ